MGGQRGQGKKAIPDGACCDGGCMEILKILTNHKSKFEHFYLVLDKMPHFVYERVGNVLLAQDGPFYSAFAFDPPPPPALLPSAAGSSTFR